MELGAPDPRPRTSTSQPGRRGPTSPTAPEVSPPKRWSRRRVLVAVAGLAGTAGAAAVAARELGAKDTVTAAPLYARCSFGAYADNSPYPDLDAHYALEKLVGARLQRMSWFQDFGAPWLRSQARAAAATGHDLCISWQPTANGGPIPFGDLLDGNHDGLLRRFFESAAAYPHRVILRPFWEMNAGVATYSVGYAGPDRQVQDVDQFKQVWRYLVRLQRKVGGARVTWFFCANGTDVGTDRMEDYWPGADFVDEVGFDTYNDIRSPWAPFGQKVAPMYERFEKLAPKLPVALGEIGCREDGAPEGESKAAWSKDMFQSSAFPRLTHVSLFHAKKLYDWRLDTSPTSLAVYRQYLPLAKA